MLRITEFADGAWRTVPFESLEERFLEICETHRAQGRALAFAFILFDRSHAYVREALAQRHYWDALDQRAGRYLSVFSVDVRPSTGLADTERRGMYIAEAPSYARVTGALSHYFDGIDSITMPSVLFFQVADAKVIGTTAVTLKQTDLATTYRELEGVIGTAADAVARVTDENAKNASEIFHLIVVALREKEQKEGAIRVFNAVRPLAERALIMELLRWIAAS